MGRLLEDMPESMNTVEDWLKLLTRDNISYKLERVTAMWGRCFVTCPVGREVES